MAIVGVDEASRILEPHIPAFNDCWNRAWSKWLLIGQAAPDGSIAVALDRRSQAATLYALMVWELEHHFANVPGVTTSKKGGFLTVNFKDVLLLRFKKVDKQLRSHNIMTRQQTLFRLQLVLPGFPDVTRADLGYQLDKLRINLQNLVVVCHTGDELEWSLPVMRPGTGSTGTGTTPIPMQPDMPKPRIERIKTAEEKAQEEAAKEEKRETGD